VEGVLAGSELKAEGLVDGQPDHSEGDVERAENHRRPGGTDLVPVPSGEGHRDQRHTPDHVQQVVA
jgi:hypothetical protein